MNNTSQIELDDMAKQAAELTSRRDFFRKAAAYSAGAVELQLFLLMQVSIKKQTLKMIKTS